MKKTLLIVILVSLSLNTVRGYAEEVTNVSAETAIPISTVKVTTVTLDKSKILPESQQQLTQQSSCIDCSEVNNLPHNVKIYTVLVKTDEFYRIEKRQRGLLVVVQDFYSTGEKRTDPYIITDKEKCKLANFSNIDYEEMGVNGLFISWFKSGQIEQKGVFDHGVRKGLWVIWYENGQKKSAGRYRSGLKEGQWTAWYQNGKRMQKGIYREGKREGVWIFWYGNGKKKEAGRYNEDQKVEQWSYWDQTGKMQKTNLTTNFD